jgi:hypothetical protein
MRALSFPFSDARCGAAWHHGTLAEQHAEIGGSSAVISAHAGPVRALMVKR